MSVSQMANHEPRGEVLEQQLDRVADQLTRKFADRADQVDVHDAVFREASRYQGARVTQYIPVLVQHTVQERLRQLRPRVASHQLVLYAWLMPAQRSTGAVPPSSRPLVCSCARFDPATFRCTQH